MFAITACVQSDLVECKVMDDAEAQKKGALIVRKHIESTNGPDAATFFAKNYRQVAGSQCDDQVVINYGIAPGISDQDVKRTRNFVISLSAEKVKEEFTYD